MDLKPAQKKLRLSSGTSRHYSNEQHVSNRNSKFSRNDDFELWGEDLAVDDDLMQKIETQAYSQYHENEAQHPEIPFMRNQDIVPGVSSTSKISDDIINLHLELQTKTGEVTNLRLEMENKMKEFRTQVIEKDNVIEDLRKQLSGKQTEIEFQKIEKMAQSCKTPKSSSTSKSILKQQQNLNNSFHDRFSFGGSSTKNVTKNTKIFDFGGRPHKGDILYKLLQSTFSSSNYTGVLHSSHLNLDNDINGEKSVENEFAVYLESYLLQLCRFCTFDELEAHDLLKLLITRSNELLLSFHRKLSRKKINSEITERKSKIMTLHKTENISASVNEQSLLKNTKLFAVEKGVYVRQTIIVLVKLLQVEPKISNMLIEFDRMAEFSSCSCIIAKNTIQIDNDLESKPTTLKDTGKSPEKMDVNEIAGGGDNERNSSFEKDFIFDVVELVHDIVQEITVRGKSCKYAGVFSSILCLYSTLCNCDANIFQKQQVLIERTIKKILFSLPNFMVVEYIIEFLSATTHYCNISNSLCCRSAAETFSENFRYFNFTKETCLLQVLCAYIEMMKKSPQFIDKFTSWINCMTTMSHNVTWMRNKTDSKLCECLLMLEQITIKIMLNCIEHHDKSTSSDKTLLKASLKRSVSIFQQFRWQDTDFDLHITTCRGDYKILLHHLQTLDDDITRKFIAQEREFINKNQRHNLTVETKNQVIESVLKLFSEDSSS